MLRFVYSWAMRQSEVLTAAGKYLAQNPEELLRAVRKAATLELGVPAGAGAQREPAAAPAEGEPAGGGGPEGVQQRGTGGDAVAA